MDMEKLQNAARLLSEALGAAVSIYDGGKKVLSFPKEAKSAEGILHSRDCISGLELAFDSGVASAENSFGERFVASRLGNGFIALLGPFLSKSIRPAQELAITRINRLSQRERSDLAEHLTGLAVHPEKRHRAMGELMASLLGSAFEEDTPAPVETSEQTMFDLSSIDPEFVRISAERSPSPPIEEVTRYIELHISGKLTLGELSDRVHLHPNYLSALFRKEMGETISGYILRKRSEEAARLLREGVPLSEAARRCGFCNQSYFAKTFRRFFDCTPQEYRRRSVSKNV